MTVAVGHWQGPMQIRPNRDVGWVGMNELVLAFGSCWTGRSVGSDGRNVILFIVRARS